MTEAFLVGGLRTPIGRYAGALSGVRPDDLLAHAIGVAVPVVSSYFGHKYISFRDSR